MYCTAVVLIAACCLSAEGAGQSTEPGGLQAPRLGVKGSQFTLDDRPVFLLGISYYGALGAGQDNIRRDLADMKKCGLNWLRLWATWAAFDNDVSAVDAEGNPRPEYLDKLRWLVAECGRQGMVVDVSLSRGNGVTGPARLQTPKAHRRAVETIVTALKGHPNWYLDLSNERNIRDRRYTSFDELKDLRQLVAQLDPKRLVTASHAGDIGRDELREYLLTVKVDFISPHRPRGPKSPGQTAAKTAEYLQWMKQLGRVVPVHYQEPFRRGFTRGWEPTAEQFLEDLDQALRSGAAGWCFHNGDQRDRPDGRPRRSFDLSQQRLMDQLDAEEQKLLQILAARHSANPAKP
jgi:hypothetical protein